MSFISRIVEFLLQIYDFFGIYEGYVAKTKVSPSGFFSFNRNAILYYCYKTIWVYTLYLNSVVLLRKYML